MHLADLPSQEVRRIRILILQHRVILRERLRLENGELHIDISRHRVILKTKTARVLKRFSPALGQSFGQKNIRQVCVCCVAKLRDRFSSGSLPQDSSEARLAVGRVETQTQT